MVETKTKRKTLWPLLLVALVIAALAVYVGVIALIPAKKIVPVTPTITVTQTNPTAIVWPAYGQAALGVAGTGVLATNGTQTGAPIGSIAKLILALSVVKEKPIKVGEQGPTIPITDADIELYKKYLAQNGSVVPVQAKEDLSEYQALQALLIPSGDNIADTLAIWAFGSVDNYLAYSNKLVADLSLKQTKLADTSGLSPGTVSSAQDLVTLATTILQQPVLAEIVSQAKVTLPVAGSVTNYNRLLGKDNIIGIKTGNTDEAGGCFLFAATTTVGDQSFTTIGAIMGAPNLSAVLADTDKFLKANGSAILPVEVVKAGQTVATYSGPWKTPVEAVATNALTAYLVKGQTPSVEVSVDPITKPLTKDTAVGKITLKTSETGVTSSVPVSLKQAAPKPGLLWRLLHP